MMEKFGDDDDLNFLKAADCACPKTGGPNTVNDTSFQTVAGELQVECHCDENEGVCFRPPTLAEKARVGLPAT